METLVNFMFEHFPPHDYPMVDFLFGLIFYPGGLKNTELFYVLNENYYRDWTGNLGWLGHHFILSLAVMLLTFAVAHFRFKHDYVENFHDLFLYEQSKGTFLFFSIIIFVVFMAILGEPYTW